MRREGEGRRGKEREEATVERMCRRRQQKERKEGGKGRRKRGTHPS